MKKYVVLLIACMCILVGCSNEVGVKDEPKVTQNANTTDEPKVTQNANTTEEPKATQKAVIMTDKAAVDGNTGLYALPAIELEEAFQLKLCKYGVDIIAVYNIYSMEDDISYTCVKIISLETGKILHERKIGELEDLRVQVINNNIFLSDYASGKAVILNGKLETVKEYTFEGGNFCFDAKGENVVLFLNDEGVIVRNLETEKEENIFDRARDMYGENISENFVSFVYVDIDTKMRSGACIDLRDFSVKKIDSQVAVSKAMCSDDTWLACLITDNSRYMLENVQSKNVFDVSFDDMLCICPQTGNILKFSCIYEDNSMEADVYDKNGNFISKCSASKYIYNGDSPIWYEEYQGYILNVINDEGQNSLMFWDISENTQGADLNLYSIDEIFKEKEAGTAVDSELYTRAKELGDKYGMEIYIADQCVTEFNMYTAELNLDENDIKTSLDYLEKAMARYPEGFFEQLKTGDVYKVEIYLLGYMEVNGEDLVPVGFVECQAGKYVMGIDTRPVELTSQTTEQIFYHEVSHMVENKLFSESAYTDKGFTEGKWTEFNPEGFVYADESDDGSFMYDEYYYAFIDEYATTNAMEDRARIMEYACYGLWKEIEVGNELKQKYHFYCDSIRKAFDTTGWPKTTLWEDTTW